MLNQRWRVDLHTPRSTHSVRRTRTHVPCAAVTVWAKYRIKAIKQKDTSVKSDEALTEWFPGWVQCSWTVHRALDTWRTRLPGPLAGVSASESHWLSPPSPEQRIDQSINQSINPAINHVFIEAYDKQHMLQNIVDQYFWNNQKSSHGQSSTTDWKEELTRYRNAKT